MVLTIDERKELIQTDEHRQLELKKTTGGNRGRFNRYWNKAMDKNVIGKKNTRYEQDINTVLQRP